MYPRADKYAYCTWMIDRWSRLSIVDTWKPACDEYAGAVRSWIFIFKFRQVATAHSILCWLILAI